MEQKQKLGLGQRLSLLAKLKGMTQEEIAQTCAISRISVNRFFRQRTEIRASDFSLLLASLGIDLDAVINKAIENQIHGGKVHNWERPLSQGVLPELKALP